MELFTDPWKYSSDSYIIHFRQNQVFSVDSPSVIWKRKKTQIEMIKDRGYLSNAEEDKLIKNKEAYINKYNTLKLYNDKIKFLNKKYYTADGSSYIYILYNIKPRKKKSDIKALITLIDNDSKNVNSKNIYLIISQAPISASNMEIIYKINYNIEILDLSFFSVNPTKHYLTPSHIWKSVV